VATFFMMGKYTPEAVKGISADRTKGADALIKKLGGEVKSMFALLGEFDLALIIDLPGTEEAMKASIGLSKLTGIGFSSAPAVAVDDFDKMMG